jgi:hypothetical protein
MCAWPFLAFLYYKRLVFSDRLCLAFSAKNLALSGPQMTVQVTKLALKLQIK